MTSLRIKSMLKKWIKRLTGMDELERRIAHQESQRTELEQKVIADNETREMMKDTVGHAKLKEALSRYLDDIIIPESAVHDAALVLDAAEAVKEYGFKRFVIPAADAYPSQVISMKEFREHPQKYAAKLSKGIFGFPLGLNFKGINKIVEEQFGRTSKLTKDDTYSPHGVFEFSPICSIKSSEPCEKKIASLFVQAAKLSDITRVGLDDWVFIDPLDFLANYSGLVRFVIDQQNLTDSSKREIISCFTVVRDVYLTALEIAGTTRIGDPQELLGYQQAEEVLPATPDDSLEHRIRCSLLQEPEGTSYYDIQRRLLPIRSKEEFRRLASERTNEIISRDTKHHGLTDLIGKELKDYSIGESVVMACYFARNIITSYESHDDAVKRVFAGDSPKGITGKCSDYTGLALHYLKEYLIPLQPEKFSGWHFGFDSDHIGGYDHCYLKALHLNQDQTVDVYLVDPTLLAQKGISALKTPKEVLKMMDMSHHPLLIQRDAEDLLRRQVSS